MTLSMHSPQAQNLPNASKWFWGILLCHLFFWTVIPTVIRYALPIDAIEATAWARQLEWGYDRNPWLHAWITRFIMEVLGNRDWPFYLMSQLCVGLAFWSVWQLGKQIFDPVYALVAVLLLEALHFYNTSSVDFNDNVLDMALWPLMALCFYQTLKKDTVFYWILLGVLAGLSVMAKYYSVVPLLAMLIFMILQPQARKCFRKPGIYISFFLFIAVCVPHFFWLFKNNFTTFAYTIDRINDLEKPGMHLYPVLKFGGVKLANFLGMLFLFSILFWGRTLPQEALIAQQRRVGQFDKLFLWVVGVGPYLITLSLSVITGWHLSTKWGHPLLALWGLVLLIYVQPKITSRRFYRFLAGVFIVFFLFLGGYTAALLLPNTSTATLPAKEITEMAMKSWHQYTTKPLRYIAGSRYLSSYIAFYSKDQPRIYIEWDQSYSPWINDSALKRSGALFVEENATHFPEAVMRRFPKLKIQPIYSIPRKRQELNQPPVKILIGVLLPDDTL